jgi:lipoyl(octanoyl) transferase
MAILHYIDMKRSSYEAALAMQRELVDRVLARDGDDAYLVLVEHVPPVITLGRSANAQHVLASAERLAAEGIEVHKSARGGDVTYHGPGQLVGYPIMRLGAGRRTVRQYVSDLEETIIRLLGLWGVRAERVCGATGVWTGSRKVAAIGVAVRRWVTWHGFALNVAVNMEHFGLIVPCGLHGKDVTDLSSVVGHDVSVEEVKKPLIEKLVEVFGFDEAVPE